MAVSCCPIRRMLAQQTGLVYDTAKKEHCQNWQTTFFWLFLHHKKVDRIPDEVTTYATII